MPSSCVDTPRNRDLSPEIADTIPAGKISSAVKIRARVHAIGYRREAPGPEADLDRLDSRNGAAIDHVLSAGNRSRSRRHQESDELCDFCGFRGPAERNAAEPLHDDLLATLVVRAGLSREALS